MSYNSDEQGRAAIKRAASEANLNADMIDVNPFVGIDGTVMDLLAIHFPGGHGMGTYEQIFAVLKESRSLADLGRECLERKLWRPEASNAV